MFLLLLLTTNAVIGGNYAHIDDSINSCQNQKVENDNCITNLDCFILDAIPFCKFNKYYYNSITTSNTLNHSILTINWYDGSENIIGFTNAINIIHAKPMKTIHATAYTYGMMNNDTLPLCEQNGTTWTASFSSLLILIAKCIYYPTLLNDRSIKFYGGFENENEVNNRQIFNNIINDITNTQTILSTNIYTNSITIASGYNDLDTHDQPNDFVIFDDEYYKNSVTTLNTRTINGDIYGVINTHNSWCIFIIIVIFSVLIQRYQSLKRIYILFVVISACQAQFDPYDPYDPYAYAIWEVENGTTITCGARGVDCDYKLITALNLHVNCLEDFGNSGCQHTVFWGVQSVTVYCASNGCLANTRIVSGHIPIQPDSCSSVNTQQFNSLKCQHTLLPQSGEINLICNGSSSCNGVQVGGFVEITLSTSEFDSEYIVHGFSMHSKLNIEASGDFALANSDIWCPYDSISGREYFDHGECNIHINENTNNDGMMNDMIIHAAEALYNLNLTCTAESETNCYNNNMQPRLFCGINQTASCPLKLQPTRNDFQCSQLTDVCYNFSFSSPPGTLTPTTIPTFDPTKNPTTSSPTFYPTYGEPPRTLYASHKGCDDGNCANNPVNASFLCTEIEAPGSLPWPTNHCANITFIDHVGLTENIFQSTWLKPALCFQIDPTFNCWNPRIEIYRYFPLEAYSLSIFYYQNNTNSWNHLLDCPKSTTCGIPMQSCVAKTLDTVWSAGGWYTLGLDADCDEWIPGGPSPSGIPTGYCEVTDHFGHNPCYFPYTYDIEYGIECFPPPHKTTCKSFDYTWNCFNGNNQLCYGYDGHGKIKLSGGVYHFNQSFLVRDQQVVIEGDPYNKTIFYHHAEPTKNPTPSPTPAPTINPTRSPTKNPTQSPTHRPTISPTPAPTTNPTFAPTNLSKNPTLTPTRTPEPTKYHTVGPIICYFVRCQFTMRQLEYRFDSSTENIINVTASNRGHIIFENVRFTSIDSTGLLFTSSNYANIQFINCYFIGHYIKWKISENAKMSFQNCEFINIQPFDDHMIHVKNALLSIANSSFINNSGFNSIIHSVDNSNLIISNSTFKQNVNNSYLIYATLSNISFANTPTNEINQCQTNHCFTFFDSELLLDGPSISQNMFSFGHNSNTNTNTFNTLKALNVDPETMIRDISYTKFGSGNGSILFSPCNRLDTQHIIQTMFDIESSLRNPTKIFSQSAHFYQGVLVCDNYCFVKCIEQDLPCIAANFISNTTNSLTLFECSTSGACQDSIVNIKYSETSMILCDSQESCLRMEINVISTANWTLECVSKYACKDIVIHLINTETPIIKCYGIQSCDGMIVYSDDNNIQLFMHTFSYNVRVHIPSDIDLIHHLHCMQNEPYLSLDGATFNGDLQQTARDLFGGGYPCQDVRFVFEAQFRCQVQYISSLPSEYIQRQLLALSDIMECYSDVMIANISRYGCKGTDDPTIDPTFDPTLDPTTQAPSDAPTASPTRYPTETFWFIDQWIDIVYHIIYLTFN
eukprot:371850_1